LQIELDNAGCEWGSGESDQLIPAQVPLDLYWHIISSAIYKPSIIKNEKILIGADDNPSLLKAVGTVLIGIHH
jgi:hypothetical protein